MGRPKTKDRILELRRVPARDLVPNPANWRQHPREQLSALRSVMADIGWADVAIARKDGDRLVLIDGHARVKLNPKGEIPTVILDVDEAEADRLLVSLDPIAAMAEANQDALRALLDRTGIEGTLLERLREQAGLNGKGGAPPADVDDIPDPPKKPITKPGDLWILGDHRLLCGDATEKADARRVLGGGRPNLMVTDPPYGVDYDPEWRQVAARAGHLAYAASRVGEVLNDDQSDWNAAWVLFPGAVVYAWAPPGPTHVVHHQALDAAGFEVRMEIIWSKPHFPISRGHYHVRHEPCIYAVRRGRNASWIGDRKQTTVWEVSLDRNVDGGHSTQKPVELWRIPLRNHEGDLYEPFLGTGTGLVAAELEERRCWAIEIEPKYCDVVVDRWQQLTGRKARRHGKSVPRKTSRKKVP